MVTIFYCRESVAIGRTDFTKAEVIKIAESLGLKYIGSKYHLLNNNCNNFTEEFCQVIRRSEYRELYIFIQLPTDSVRKVHSWLGQ